LDDMAVETSFSGTHIISANIKALYSSLASILYQSPLKKL
jgi:hypothetical protein